MWLLLVPVCLVIFSSPLTSASEPHYVITVPINLAQGADEKACVTFLDLKGAVDLKLVLKKDDQVHPIAEQKIDAHDHIECYTFKVPVIKEVYSVWSLHVTAHGDHVNVDESKKVAIIKQDICAIQTDKLFYKPGDTVKIWVISMDRNYHTADKIYPLVELTDANKQRIAQWRDVSTNHGFAEFSFHLANELSLGDYIINLPDSCIKAFRVAEYVPQRFEVNIITPSHVHPEDKSFHLEVCGRYTYGKPVEGTMDLSICPKRYISRYDRYDSYHSYDGSDTNSEEDEGHTCIKIEKVKTDSNGCLSKDINLGFFHFTKSDSREVLEIKLSLTEDQTGHIEEASADINLKTYKKIKFLEKVYFYQKGLPYHTKVKLTNEKNQPVPNTAIYVYIGNVFDQFSGKPHTTVVTDENGIAHFTLNTATWYSVQAVMATFLSGKIDDEYDDKRYSEDYIRISPLDSQSNSQLTIDRPAYEVQCDSDQTVTVGYDINRKALDSDTNHLHIFYLLRSKSGILLFKEHKIDIKNQSNNSTIHGSFPIHIHFDADTFPYATLLVFSVLPNGETIANIEQYEVPLCAKEKVQIKFSEEQVLPGASVNLEVLASAGSLCAIRSVDKGYLLKHPEDRSLLSDLREEILGMVSRITHSPLIEAEESDSHQCPENETVAPVFFPSSVNVYMLFKGGGLRIFTNTQIRRPVECVKSEFRARSGTKVKKPDDKDKAAPFTRRYFPDTWLFELHPVGTDGRSVLNRTTPHSITKWVTDAFCLGKIGIAEVKDVELTTFQPYFIDLIVPYSVVQGEKFTIQAVVFTYVKKCLLIVVSLPNSEELASVKNKDQARCVCEGHSHSFTWDVTTIKPKTLQIHVNSGALEVDGKCTEDPVLIGVDRRQDSVEKTIIVKSRGLEAEKTQTFLIYPSESKEEIPITLNLPERLVPGSERAHVIILGDLLANAAANLDNLLYLPGGCGEQNLAKIFIYVHALVYLDLIQELTPEKKAEIKESLVEGYQKQLTFRSRTGSYGFFPGDEANIWVTALVVKAFNIAQKWIYIDENHIQEAVNWLQTVQLPNGCFTDKGYYFNNQLEAENDVARTAFILISLLEYRRAYNGSIVEDALSCVRKSVDSATSMHTQALLAYAFTLSGDHEQRDQILKKLDEIAVKEEGSKHWEKNSDHRGEIETASYILLALLSDKTTTTRKRLEESANIIRWLVSHQNPYGGFRSSQDTVVALQALAKYAKATKHMKGDSTVTIRSKSGFRTIVHVDNSNSLLVQTVDLPKLPGVYTVNVTGDGLVYVQSHIHYHILPDPSESGHFSLNVSSEQSVCTHESQKKFNVHMNVRYSGKRQNTNMAVILFEPVSGYIPDKKSIRKLKKNPLVKRTEVSAKKVSIYLERLTHETESFVFSLEQETNVENLQPATVTVYDYYDPVEHYTVEYSAPCSAVLAHCDVNVDERADCGHAAISREECENKGCCFNSSVHRPKWCFFKGFKKIENH